jgi:chemotaxis methyl-accepting protein methylase
MVTSRMRQRLTDVQLIERDIFHPTPEWAGRFDIIRIANLLNLAYFPDSLLRIGVRNAITWLRKGGYLMVGRTDSEGTNHATLFRRDGTSLAAVERLGEGSEIAALLLSGTAAPSDDQ